MDQRRQGTGKSLAHLPELVRMRWTPEPERLAAKSGRCRESAPSKRSPSSFLPIEFKAICVDVEEAELRGVLSRCPVLTSLALQQTTGSRRLRVSSPTLGSLGVANGPEGTLEDVTIVDAPLLERLVSDGLLSGGLINIWVVRAPRLKEMKPLGLNNAMGTVKILAIATAPILDVIGILQCFPCVEKLHIVTLQLTEYRGSGSQVDLVRFFLSNARVLERVRFAVTHYLDKKWVARQREELQRLDHACRDAAWLHASLLAAVVAMVAAAAVFGAASGASYTVGGPAGSWDLQTNLTAWASTIDFQSGDQVVFNYDASAHDVVQVDRDGYSSCSPAGHNVSAALRTGSDAVQLAGIGSFYFICGVPGHCDAGMSWRSSPPSAAVTNGTPGGPGANGTPGGVCVGGDSPTTIIMTPPGINNDDGGSAAPGSPSSANRLISSFLAVTMVYTVGEPGGSWDLQTNLTAWGSAIDFHPGDQFVFKYDASAHDVVEVSQDGYSSCSAASPISAADRTGNHAVLLTGTRSRYFICSVPGHCDAGMKLQVRVVDAAGCNNTLPWLTPAPPGVPSSPGITICSDGPTTVIISPGVVSYSGAAPGSSASLSSLLVTMVLVLLGFITA
ncbi:hypothetical protein U9M48_040949 [Paspalum notatum var. saurae]|uniref:Phytocyanin domain-containing protein n=1 Tax=Paspalum notatum var. saurae TaxID=547442 RepID=A0AAQ3UM67_PASNO